MTGLPNEFVGVDPCFWALLGNPRNNLRPPRPGASLIEYRRILDSAMLDANPPAIHAVEELQADFATHSVPLRLYRPDSRTDLPTIMFLHGGGFVIGSLDTHDGLCRALANASGAVVIAVDYRKAPETVFPGALDDCCVALDWVVARSAELRLDSTRLALCGDSAGANLAISTALRARAKGLPLRHLALIYPAIDPDMRSDSCESLATGYILTRAFIGWFWEAYFGRPYDPRDPAMNVMAAELSGLPPTTIVTAEFDPLRDEGETFARAAAAAGTPVIARRYLGMIHGFVSLTAMTHVAAAAIRDTAGDLRRSLRVP